MVVEDNLIEIIEKYGGYSYLYATNELVLNRTLIANESLLIRDAKLGIHSLSK